MPSKIRGSGLHRYIDSLAVLPLSGLVRQMYLISRYIINIFLSIEDAFILAQILVVVDFIEMQLI